MTLGAECTGSGTLEQELIVYEVVGKSRHKILHLEVYSMDILAQKHMLDYSEILNSSKRKKNHFSFSLASFAATWLPVPPHCTIHLTGVFYYRLRLENALCMNLVDRNHVESC